jgi:hypothetical protein
MSLPDLSISGPLTFSDLPDEEAIKYAGQMTSHSKPSFEEPLTYAGYADVEECHYVFCEEDKIISPQGQEAMIGIVNRARQEKGEGEAKVWRIKSDHCPVVSHVEELGRVVKEILS